MAYISTAFFKLPLSDKSNLLIRIAFVALIYYVAARLSDLFVFGSIFDHNQFLPYWPPPGLMLGLMLLLGRSVWPGIAIGSLLLTPTDLWFVPGHTSDNIMIAVFYTVGRILEALAGYSLLKRWSPGSYLATQKDMFIFIIVALIISPIGAGLSAFGLNYFMVDFSLSAFLTHWFSWYGDNVIGILLFAPLVFAIAELKGRKISKRAVGQAILFVLIWAGIFYTQDMFTFSNVFVHARPFLMLTILFWLALNFPAIISLVSLILISIMLSHYLAINIGLFAGMESPHDTRLLMQSFLGVASISTLFLNALVKERKQIKQNLRSSEARLQYMLASSPAIIYTLPANGGNETSFMSPNVITQLGYTPADFLSDKDFFFKNLHPDDRPMVQQALPTIFNHDKLSLTYRFRHKNNSWRWMQDELLLVRDEKGNSIEIVGAWIDVTQQKQAEEARDHARKKASDIDQYLKQYKFALHSASIVSITNPQGIILYANEKFSEISQYSLEELVSQKHSLINSGHHSKKFWAEMWRTIGNGETWRADVKNKAKDGSFYWVDTFIVPIKDASDKIIEYISIRNDITEKKKHEQELVRLSLIAQETSNYVFITDREGRLEWVNESFEKATGYLLEEIKGRRPDSFLHGQDTQASTSDYIIQMFRDQEPFACEILHYTKGGESYWVQLNCQPIADETGKVTGFFALMRNTTVQKTLIKNLEEARNKAEESDRLKSAFIANMSHEIRTPMQAILGLSELLDRPVSEEKRKKFTSTISQRAKDLLLVMNDVLDISRIQAGFKSSVITKGNVEELLMQLASGYQTDSLHVQQKEVEIKWFNELKGEENNMLADFLHLKQVLNNLLSNALKFTDAGLIEFGCELQDGNTLLFSVRDSGVGIAKEKQEQIFKPFRQANETIHINHGGSGLGLAISKGLVSLWGGRIWVESEEGKGSVFYFTMPYVLQN